MFWVAVFGLSFVMAAAGAIYLASRFYRFWLMGKLAKGKKVYRIAASVFTVLLLLLVTGKALGPINAVVCLLHLAASINRERPVKILLCRGLSYFGFRSIFGGGMGYGPPCMEDGLSGYHR